MSQKITLSNRVNRVKPSPTLAVTALAAKLKAEGRDVIGLGAGEPDFSTPAHICAAAKQAIDDGFTGYTQVDGTPALKTAVIQKFKKENGHEYTPEQILVSVGGKQSFFNLAQALLNEGDEVIIPAPYWVSYPDMVKLADATPVIVTAGQNQNFKLLPAQLEAAITDNTKLFCINSPSNPTGVAYTKAELRALADILVKYPHVMIATDDMYEHILWSDEPFSNILMVAPELYERTIVLNGVSKAYAMTGWRIGYAGGPEWLIKAMKKVQGQSTSNPTSIAQVAATTALENGTDCVKEMLVEFKKRHDYVYQALNHINGFSCLPSDGTFYSFPNVESAMSAKGCETDTELAGLILEKTGVALVPGSAFGLDGHMRLSFATSMEQLQDAIERLDKFFT